MESGRSGKATFLGMVGFEVRAGTEEAEELFISVETTAKVAGCASSGVRATGRGRSAVQVRDRSPEAGPSG